MISGIVSSCSRRYSPFSQRSSVYCWVGQKNEVIQRSAANVITMSSNEISYPSLITCGATEISATASPTGGGVFCKVAIALPRFCKVFFITVSNISNTTHKSRLQMIYTDTWAYLQLILLFNSMQTLLKRIFLYFKIQNSQACISEYFIMIVFKLQQIY